MGLPKKKAEKTCRLGIVERTVLVLWNTPSVLDHPSLTNYIIWKIIIQSQLLVSLCSAMASALSRCTHRRCPHPASHSTENTPALAAAPTETSCPVCYAPGTHARSATCTMAAASAVLVSCTPSQASLSACFWVWQTPSTACSSSAHSHLETSPARSTVCNLPSPHRAASPQRPLCSDTDSCFLVAAACMCPQQAHSSPWEVFFLNSSKNCCCSFKYLWKSMVIQVYFSLTIPYLCRIFELSCPFFLNQKKKYTENSIKKKSRAKDKKYPKK